MPASRRPDPAWQRLADLLVMRRVELDPRYRNRRTFCEEKQLDYRVISDIESARRTNFSQPMLTAIEVAYGWASGSIQRVLDGGDPTPVMSSRNTDTAGFAEDRSGAEARLEKILATVRAIDAPLISEAWDVVQHFDVQDRIAIMDHFIRQHRAKIQRTLDELNRRQHDEDDPPASRLSGF